MQSGKLIVVSGPSGAGKGTVIKHALLRRPDLVLGISATTRKPRNGEVNDVDYHFKTHAEFDKLIRENDLLEWAEVHGEHYGTIRSLVEDYLSKKVTYILEIDPQGALQVRDKKDCLLIFIAPPDLDELRRRLVERNTETPEQIEKRMRDAAGILAEKDKYDVVIVNEDLDETVDAFLKTIEEYESQE